jgi:type IV pilus assembly protein PilV
MKSKQKHKNNALSQSFRQLENGFTLIELMIAIVVLSIGLLASVSMQISAINMNSSANALTEATNIARCRLEEAMALKYSADSCDPGLIDDAVLGNSESFTDLNGNAAWDFGEDYVDSNRNGVWDAAHVDQKPPQGYTIAYSVTDNRPAEYSKLIRMYVTRNQGKKTILLSCVKPRE